MKYLSASKGHTIGKKICFTHQKLKNAARDLNDKEVLFVQTVLKQWSDQEFVIQTWTLRRVKKKKVAVIIMAE